MLPAEIINTAAKPKMIFERNLRVGNIERFDGGAMRADIPISIFYSAIQGKPVHDWIMEKR
ncbi:hypothetical protein Q3C01_27365 [Bradyrhizobium sp. UFLA05-109]